MVNRLLVVPAVAPRRHLGGHRRGAAGAGADQGRARPRAERGDPRQPVGQAHGKGGPRGYDGGKKVAGRKRSLLVDTGGLVLARRVDPADVPDREGAKRLLAPLKGHLPRLAKVWMDGGYKGEFEAWLAQELGWAAEVVQHPDAGIRHVWLPAGAPPPEPRPKGFRLLPRRWVVERTFAWLGRNRRLAKDHEGRCETGEAWIDLAMIRLLASRLARRRLSTQLLIRDPGDLFAYPVIVTRHVILNEVKDLYSGTRRIGVIRSVISRFGERFFACGLRMTGRVAGANAHR